jgi:hypothetical protein
MPLTEYIGSMQRRDWRVLRGWSAVPGGHCSERLSNVLRRLAAQNGPVPFVWGYPVHPRTWTSVRKLLSPGAADRLDRPDRGGPTDPLGKPVFISSNFPINQMVGASTDCSSILLADISQVVVASLGSGRDPDVHRLWVRLDQIALRVTGRYDIDLPQPTAPVKAVGVRP